MTMYQKLEQAIEDVKPSLQDLLNDGQMHKSVARIMFLQKALGKPVVYTKEYPYLREARAICTHIMSMAKAREIK